MSGHVVKYNPAFLTAEELAKQFVVRLDALEKVLQTIRENTTGANQHLLVIGPRGSGKTMLVRRVAVAIERDPELSSRWYPLIFSEESYEVTTPGEFWLEAAFHLGQQTKDPRWQAKYEEYGLQWQDEETMRERALGQLMAFADAQGKRLLVIVENLDTLLGKQLTDDDAWKLRHTLQNEPRVMLLATATSRFEEISQANKAMYELFRVQLLRPLDRDECRTLWQALTGQELEGIRVRPIHILTGGNLRLLTILSTFGVQQSLRQLMQDLVRLVDEHTEYFKSHLDSLPPTERKVYLALAELWDPSTAREVSRVARMEVSATSSLLSRLVERGAVVTVEARGRTKWYQVSERMYNIYYLFRRRGSPAERVRAVVRFMVTFYQPKELVCAARNIADELPALAPGEREDHYQVYCDLVSQMPTDTWRSELVELARQRLSTFDDLPESLAQMIRRPRETRTISEDVELLDSGETKYDQHLQKASSLILAPDLGEAVEALHRVLDGNPYDAKAWMQLGELLHEKLSRYEEAEQAYRKAVEIDPKMGWAWVQLGELLHEKLSRYEEAEQAYRKAVEIDPKMGWAWTQLGELLQKKLSRYEEAEQAYRKAIEVKPQYSWVWAQLGELLHEKLSRYEEAEQAYRMAIEIRPQYDWAWAQLGLLLHEKLSRNEEAEQAYRKAIELDPKYTWAWAQLGRLLHEKLSRHEEAEQAYRKAIELDPKIDWTWAHLGQLLHEKLSRYEEAEQAYRKAIELRPQYDWAWAQLGELLHEKLSRYEEAEQAYRKAIELDPKYTWAWVRLGQLLHEKLSRHEEAEQAYRKAIELDPKIDWTWAQLGQLLHEKLSRYEEAEQAYRKAIEIDPLYAWAWAQLGQLLHEKLSRHEEAEQAYRKAIEIRPQYRWAWAQLGELLHEKLSRYEEAEQAYRKAIELDPKYTWAWMKLGQLLHGKLSRHGEAEQAYRKAIEIDSKMAWAWMQLGELLNEKLSRYEEAEQAYRKAIEINPAYTWIHGALLRLLLRQMGRREEALEVAETAIRKSPNDPQLLNSLAWALYEAGEQTLFERARSWAQEATSLTPEDGVRQHTLATILCALGNFHEALKAAERYLADTVAVKRTSRDAIDLFVELTARGQGQNALKILVESPARVELEPLITGIRLFLGQDVKIATEINEIGRDVARRIEERANQWR